MIRVKDDQVQCAICGKDFPLSADGEELLRAHLLAERAIDSAAGSASVRDTHEAMTQLPLAFAEEADGAKPTPFAPSGTYVDEELF